MLELTQAELKALRFALNSLFDRGGLALGDAYILTPLAQKIQDKITPDPEEIKNETPLTNPN